MTKDQLIKRLKDLGHPVLEFMIIGVRSKADKANEFDDKIYLIDKDDFQEFTGTTNPGTHWLQNFLSPKGTAVLAPGLYIYKLGKHKGYDAFVQAAPVTVYRDADKDLKSEATNVTETGWFGINIHRANPSAVSKFINSWSAGCQVLNDPKEFNYLLNSAQESGLKKFPYYLLDQWT